MMIAKVDKNEFKKALRIGTEIIEKTPMEILSNVLLEFDEEKETINISTYNLEDGYRTQVNSLIKGETTSFCVSCKKFYEIVNNFSDEIIILTKEKKKDKLIIKNESETVYYELSIAKAEDFPNLPNFNIENLLEIPGEALFQLINKTKYCTSKDDIKHVLGGIYIEADIQQNKLKAVASDGHRLALYETEVLGIEQANFEGFILSKKSADIISKIAKNNTLVKFGYIDGHIVLLSKEGFFFTRTMEGTYPDYKQVIPDEKIFKNVLIVNRKEFVENLKRIALLQNEKFRPVILNLGSEIILTSPETEIGQAQIKLFAEYQGEDMVVSFNSDYLISALENMVSDQIQLRLKDNSSPGLLTGELDENFLYLVMPMVI